MDLSRFSAPIRSFLEDFGAGARPMPLAGECSLPEEMARIRQLIEDTRTQTVFPGARDARGALAGLWLYANALEESHQVSQQIHTPTGSYWHGIMHRREPDAGNSAYWFRRVGQHPVFAALLDSARAILNENPVSEFRPGSSWDPFAFIGFCEAARRRPGSKMERIAMAIQLVEWQLLFSFCALPPDK